MIHEAIIFDIDGTLTDLTHRLHFVKRPNKDKDYPSFETAAVRDIPKVAVIHTLQSLSRDFKIVLLSGRKERQREVTEKWLCDNKVVYNELLLRPDDNFEADEELKYNFFCNKIQPKYDVVAVFDDRQSVVDMWRGLGLTCFQVEQWTE